MVGRMSAAAPNAPSGFKWLFLEIDIPIARDFIAYEERKSQRKMSNEEATEYLMREFSFGRNRAKQIVDTVMGEIF